MMMIKHGFAVFMILFVSVSIVYVGIACEENPIKLVVETPEPIQLEAEIEFEKIYDMVSKGNYYPGHVTSLILIANSIDKLAEAIKEHECSSN